MCYHPEFGRSAFKGVCINTGEPKKLGSAGTRSALLGVADAKKETPPTCYDVKFGNSATKSLRINKKEPQMSE